LDYISSLKNDSSVQRRFFANRANFYGHDSLSSDQVAGLIQRYQRQWPGRKWSAIGKAQVVSASGGQLQIVQPFRWEVTNGSRSESGFGRLRIQVRRTESGRLEILSVQQL
jgi:hypothetical protein